MKLIETLISVIALVFVLAEIISWAALDRISGDGWLLAAILVAIFGTLANNSIKEIRSTRK
jgi:hypothetical protein